MAIGSVRRTQNGQRTHRLFSMLHCESQRAFVHCTIFSHFRDPALAFRFGQQLFTLPKR
jgi:hypothetical protein